MINSLTSEFQKWNIPYDKLDVCFPVTITLVAEESIVPGQTSHRGAVPSGIIFFAQDCPVYMM